MYITEENATRVVRAINSHLGDMKSYCYVDTPGPERKHLRIARARSTKGIVLGRIVVGSHNDWEVLPVGSQVVLV